MIEKVCAKAGLPVGDDGKHLRCYTNGSESMNKTMKTAKDAFLQKNPSFSTLNKMQFTKHVFEAIHNKQREELCSAIATVSDAYELSNVASYLRAPPDVWFEWAPSMREKYMQKIDALSMEEVLQQKEVSWPDIETPESTRFTEFKEPKSFSRDLLENFGYSAENAETLENEVLALLNHPYAIQRKASLEVDGLIRFEVASKTAKNGTVEVKVFKDHSSCICGRYRSDGICKHSLAVASLQSQLPKHLDFIRKRFKRDGNRTSLAEYNVRKDTAGKKGARNKVSYRAERAKGRSASSTEGKGNNQNQPFTEIHHNDNQFNLLFLTEEADTCKSCGIFVIEFE